MRRVAPVPLLAVLTACASTPGPVSVYEPAPGINEVLSGAIEAAPGHSLVVGDLVMPPGSEIPRHYHYGEEFIYVLGGSTSVSRAGFADVVLGPGDSVRVAPGTVHWGFAGSDGVRLVSAWVKPDDKPLRVAAE